MRAAGLLAAEVWGFLRDSTPSRRRSRYGDVDYDWEHRVDTTGATVGWRDRLLGVFHSPYQPTDPALFAEMMESLRFGLSGFTFIDVGSGKGRTLLMAAEYPFRRVVGVELLPSLHRVAVENLKKLAAEGKTAGQVEAVCGDAAEFEFPEEPVVLYLFNPLPEGALRRMVAKLDESLDRRPRPFWVLYANPLLEAVVADSRHLKRVSGTGQYAVYASGERAEVNDDAVSASN